MTEQKRFDIKEFFHLPFEVIVDEFLGYINLAIQEMSFNI